MIKIIVGSLNPVKINAVKIAISEVLSLDKVECVGIDAPSEVDAQPLNSEVTRQGAINRVKFCQQHQQADFYVAIEGGVDQFEYGPATFAYIAIADSEQVSIGRSCNLPLPPAIYQALIDGEELGNVMDRLFSTDNVKQKEGAIGLLTNGQATRQSVYTQAAVLAMAPFLNPDLYGK